MLTYRMTLTMLAPVHIGSGEEIDPIDYVVTQKGRGDDAMWVLHALNTPAFLARLSDVQRSAFVGAANQRSLTYLRKFIAENADLNRDVRWSAPCSEEIFQRYQQGLNSDQSQLLIQLMTREPMHGRAYIPGSSIKGALRTAWLQQLADRYGDKQALRELDVRRGNAAGYEAVLMGNLRQDRHGAPTYARPEIRADPFRALHVGDAPLCADSNRIEPITIYNPSPRRPGADASGIQMYYDMTFSALDNEPITATGRLQVDPRLSQRFKQRPNRWDFDACVSGAISAGDLLKACRRYYEPRLEKEIELFPRLAEPGRRILEKARACGDSEALIRMGRFSHRECVTLDAPSRERHTGPGKTRSLAFGEWPLGWAVIGLSPTSP